MQRLIVRHFLIHENSFGAFLTVADQWPSQLNPRSPSPPTSPPPLSCSFLKLYGFEWLQSSTSW